MEIFVSPLGMCIECIEILTTKVIFLESVQGPQDQDAIASVLTGRYQRARLLLHHMKTQQEHTVCGPESLQQMCGSCAFQPPELLEMFVHCL